MNQVPFSQRPSFRSLILAVVLLGIYVYYAVWGGGILQNAAGVVLELLLLEFL